MVGELYDWINEIHVELLEAKQSTREADKNYKATLTKMDKVKSLASKQLSLLEHLKLRLDKTKMNLPTDLVSVRLLSACGPSKYRSKKSNPLVNGAVRAGGRSILFP